MAPRAISNWKRWDFGEGFDGQWNCRFGIVYRRRDASEGDIERKIHLVRIGKGVFEAFMEQCGQGIRVGHRARELVEAEVHPGP